MKFRFILLICLMVGILSGCDSSTQKPASSQPSAPVLLDTLTMEAGETFPDPVLFLTDPKDPVPTVVEGLSEAQLSTPGTYSVILTCGDHSYRASVCVVDTTPPVGTAQALTCTEELPQAPDFLTQVADATEVTTRYETEPLRQNGTQTVVLVLTDTSGNTSKLEASLTLDLDMEAPQIHGVQDILVDQGQTVSYRKGVTVTDNRDPSPLLSIDSGSVDLSIPGTYTVVYTATDAAGNKAEAAATVTVREMKSNYASLETVYAMVDALLEDILEEDMTVRQQLYAIDRWFWHNCVYTTTSDKSDLHQAAYTMMTKYRGDCYNYYALVKLMLERLEIPNIDVRKVKNHSRDSDHYWSLVSLDGGETWYHFDCSPRVDPELGQYVHVFLFTDAELDAYSAKNGNCYNRDKSLYPATPEK